MRCKKKKKIDEIRFYMQNNKIKLSNNKK